MTHVLVCVEKPASPDALSEWNQWMPFLDDLQKRPKLTEGIQNPVENVWLFPLDSGLKALGEFLHLLQGRRLKHTVLLLEGEPKVCA